MSGEGGLFEREREIDQLDAMLARARTGDGGVVLIEGPAGIGKTSLLAETRRRAAGIGMAVHAARATQLERDFAFGIARQLLEERVETATPAERERLLAGAARLGVGALGVVDDVADSAEPSYGIIHGLYWLVANAASDQPLLLVVDDVQWADLASLRFLNYVARRLERVPALLALGVRTGEADIDALLRIAADEHALVMALRPLTRRGTAQMLEARFGRQPDLAFADACHTQTSGNPFLLHELALTLHADGFTPDADTSAKIEGLAPKSVARSILLRLGTLGPHAIALAQAVAAVGDGNTVSVCAEIADIDMALATKTAAALQRAEIFAPTPLLSFVHPLIGSAIDSSLTDSEHSALHARAAISLEARGYGPDRIAPHLMRTEPIGDSARAAALHGQGQQALHRGAPSAARRLLDRALAEPPAADARPGVLIDLGTAELLDHDLKSAAEHFTTAVGLTADVAIKAARGVLLARAVLLTEGATAAVRLLDPLIADLTDDDRELRLSLDAEIAGYGAMDGTTARAIWSRLDPYVDVAGDTPGERRVLAALCSRWQYDGSVPAATAIDAARRATANGKLLHEGGAGALDWIAVVSLLARVDERADAERLAADLVEHARRTGWLDGYALTQSLLAMLRLRAGRLREADEFAQTSIDTVADVDTSPLRAAMTLSSRRMLAESLLEQGRYSDARAMVAGIDGSADVRAPHLPFLLARLDAAQGRFGDALKHISRLRQIEADTGLVTPEFPWRVTEVEVLASQSDAERAGPIAAEQLAIARAWGVSREIGIALRAEARIERGARRVAALAESVKVLDASPARLELAKSLVDLGTALRMNGDRDQAKVRLARGADLAADCGAAVLARRAVDELRILGARPRRVRISGVDALTASERRVAQLAASGMTNREIGQALFVTPKSVEVHLTNTYRKLSINSRTQLAAALEIGTSAKATG